MSHQRLRGTIRITAATLSILVLFGLAWWLASGSGPFQRDVSALGVPATKTTEGSFLRLHEIGVEIPLYDLIADAVYAPFSVPSTDGSKVFGVSSESIISSRGNDACNPDEGPLGLIIATSDPVVVTGPDTVERLTPDNKTVFKFDTTYYRYVPPQELACEGGAVARDKVQTSQRALAESFTKLRQGGDK